jgi:urease accessory protein
MAGRIRATTTPTGMIMPMGPERPAAEAGAATLFAWFSPAFPTGGFAYSHGLEAAVVEGLIAGEQGLGDWLEDILGLGGGFTDAVLFALAWRAARAGDDARLLYVAELSAALAPSRERLAETVGQGEAFLAAVRAGWPERAPAALPRRVAYPAAAGAAAASLGTDPDTALAAYLTGFCANLIAAGVRLGLCGQTGGVRLLSRLAPLVWRLAGRAAQAGEDDLGACALTADIASMRHETLDGRLFLS